ncbi:MAG: hypothetical protein ABFE08_09545 [Armatimonadia bacterium]
MKRVLFGMAAALVCCIAIAGSTEYVSKTGSGTTAATVYWPADAQKTARLVGVIATSDKAASVISLRTGTTAYTITVTNATTTSINQWLNTTNGLVASGVVVLQKPDGTCYSSTIAAGCAETNMVILASGGFGVVAGVGDQMYLMSDATSIKLGATTLSTHGPAIYVGNRGRPVRMVVDGTSACSIDAATAAYE